MAKEPTYNDGMHEERVRCMHLVQVAMPPSANRERIVQLILGGEPAWGMTVSSLTQEQIDEIVNKPAVTSMNEGIKVVAIDDQDATGIGTLAPADEQKSGGWSMPDFAKAVREMRTRAEIARDRLKAAPDCTCMLCEEDRRQLPENQPGKVQIK